MPLEETMRLGDLYPSLDNEGLVELFQVQLNRFTCGSLVMGITVHHYAADGYSTNLFVVAWARIVRDATTTPSPFLDRQAISVPRNPPKCVLNHQDIEFKKINSPTKPHSPESISNLVVHFNKAFISQLKAQVPFKCTTFECLLAHLWKKITIARKVNEDELTKVKIAVNGRLKLRQLVSMNYFGNLVLWAYPRVCAGDLVRSSIARIVTLIKNEVGKVDESYFKSFIDFGEIWKREGYENELTASAPKDGTLLAPDLEVDSLLGINSKELDFGTGAPYALVLPDIPVDGLLVFATSYKDDGGVDVSLALQDEHLKEFKRICYSLELPSNI